MSIPAPSDVANPPSDAKSTASGLQYKLISGGEGTENPLETSKVTVHYTGWMTNGTMFDSSVLREEPITFTVNQVIAGWTEALQLMSVGEKSLFWIPEDLTYQIRPGSPSGVLVFEIHLLAIED